MEKEWSREDARAAVSDQQMRSAVTPYPVDRYLVESRKGIDMVNIIDDDIWNPEPALRPEDEILLRKLHDMLQTTADDLKLLSGELSKYHEPGVLVKTLPMPLDEVFNEKIHIEEVVNAKFNGNKIIDKNFSSNVPQKDIIVGTSQNLKDKNNSKKSITRCVNSSLITKKQPLTKKLQVSRTKIIEINDKFTNKNLKDNNIKLNIPKQNKIEPTVAYNEFSHEYVEPIIPKKIHKSFQIQEMPSINIRSELSLQKVSQIDILPENKETNPTKSLQRNALVIEMSHEPEHEPLRQKEKDSIIVTDNKPFTRKVSTMSAYESSESNNISSDSQKRLGKYLHKTYRKLPEMEQTVVQSKNNISNRKNSKRHQASLDEWKKKLNSVYGRQLNTKTQEKNKISSKISCKQSTQRVKSKEKNDQIQTKHSLNNTEYIPYSKLTLGGVNLSDIEREISHIPNKNDMVLSPILDKILSSRENSFHSDTPSKSSKNKGKILTTSDENLLQEVIDVEMKVTNLLTNKKVKITTDKIKNYLSESAKEFDSYIDDFEDEKSGTSIHEQSQAETSKSSEKLHSDLSCQEDNKINLQNLSEKNIEGNKIKESVGSPTITKVSNLSFKNSVDVFEYVHSVETQDTGTQSNALKKITPQETQTSPKDDRANVQPTIHNDLWPSIYPRGEVEKMFKLEKEFIKKLIIDEYGDLLEKSLNKPSTSRKTENENTERNMAASQKITQTSPAHVKSVMTSPTRTKTRTTSPFALSVTANQQTSPVLSVSKQEELKIEFEHNGDLGISANLSSPRFSLRLPQSSREVLSKLNNSNQNIKYDKLRKNDFTSSSSVDGDYSSSDISSLGEINKKFKRLRKTRIPSISEISSSSLSKDSSDPSGAVLPLRSEGEASVGQTVRKKTNKNSRSEGEISLGQMR